MSNHAQLSWSERAAVRRVLSELIAWPDPDASETLRSGARDDLRSAMTSIESIFAARPDPAAAWRAGWIAGNRWAFDERDADDIKANPYE